MCILNDLEMLNHVLENGSLDARTLDAFADMASKLAASGSFSLKPKQKAWVEKEHLRQQAGALSPKATVSKKDREFGLKEKAVEKINCGQLPLFPPGGSSNSPRHNAR